MSIGRLLAVAAIALAVACGSSTGSGGNPPPPPPPPPPPAGGHTTTISVANNSFSPTPDTIPAGNITFHWAANAITHNVTWQTGPAPFPMNSATQVGGDPDYVATLKVGTYTYHCTVHPVVMTGTIVVQ